ncbi:hypothetical protein [Nocardioides sp. YIM 152588]|uniref:hypothetical protein n=1 Tax=Nocardioides sp. YIM 152588 TaxID=3158259 RepID=UPI0032E52783
MTTNRMTPRRTSVTRTIGRRMASSVAAATVGALLAVIAVVGGTALIAPTSATTGASAASTASGTSGPETAPPPIACGALKAKLPDALLADLQALRGLDAPALKAGLREIRRTALMGEYGPRAKRFVTHRLGKKAWHRMRPALRREIRGILHLPAEDRPAAAQVLLDEAAAGEYGPRARHTARVIKRRMAACAG